MFPRSFAELVRPENKGKIAVSGDTTGVRFIGAMIQGQRRRDSSSSSRRWTLKCT